MRNDPQYVATGAYLEWGRMAAASPTLPKYHLLRFTLDLGGKMILWPPPLQLWGGRGHAAPPLGTPLRGYRIYKNNFICWWL